jgi:hypothetical protein
LGRAVRALGATVFVMGLAVLVALGPIPPSRAAGAATSGDVRAWGDNFAGQLGDGTTTGSALRVQTNIGRVKKVKGGRYHSLARLWERWKYRDTGYSPFGVCLRPKNARRALSGQPATLPFGAWEWRPPYLPLGTRIDVAARMAASEPLVFATPYNGRPDALPEERRQPILHPRGVVEITGLRITLPAGEPTSGAVHALNRAGAVSFEMGNHHLAEIEFDHGSQGQSVDFRTSLPLRFRW